ncbi:unnamed protein product [Toxocara canis]|uniref:Fibropellin-1 n=1 Tax=Toxocara canis TaxID=6265 RepID=A0A183UFY4_TOXCA|nr:unnamed protein product [Toxocara canis]
MFIITDGTIRIYCYLFVIAKSEATTNVITSDARVRQSGQGSEAVRACQSNVCLNGGTCEVNDEERSFRCICLAAFTGVLCESELPCDPPCQNGGHCIANAAGHHCECPNDYFGDSCEIGTLDCTVQGCAPGERCIRMDDGGSAVCITDVCFPNPCLNNANCTSNDNGFSCVCASGFEGRLCSHDIDECAISPCQHGARCVNMIGSFSCVCPKGYRGRLCEEESFCDVDPCLNGGTCKEDGNGYWCICPPGFSSENCQERLEEKCNCSSAVHVCIDGRCTCPPGFAVCVDFFNKVRPVIAHYRKCVTTLLPASMVAHAHQQTIAASALMDSQECTASSKSHVTYKGLSIFMIMF